MLFSKRERIIKKAIKKTISDFANRSPKIFEHFFYGAFDLDPRRLAVWFLFETNGELETAKASGYCDELAWATMNNLFDLGYPKEVFDMSCFDVPMFTIVGETEESLCMMQPQIYRKALVSFTTKEAVDNTDCGDFRVYFQ